MGKKISVIIPFFNEALNITRIYEELRAVRKGPLAEYDFEILLMDNHSSDTSFAIASEIAAQDPEVKVIRLSRNFGFQANILTGYLNATGDAVVQLDADGEDDPALIPTLVERWNAGYKVVYGVRRRRSESFLLSLQRKIFYRLVNWLSKIPIPLDAGDFRLVDRQVVDVIKQFKEANPYLRGLIAYAGFEQVGVAYDRRPRYAGESKFNWWGYASLAWNGIISSSSQPLRLAIWAGLILSAASFVGGFGYLGWYLMGGIPVKGFTTLVLVQLFLAGIQLLCIGLMGTYVGAIFDEVKRRPRSVVEKSVGVDEDVPEKAPVYYLHKDGR